MVNERFLLDFTDPSLGHFGPKDSLSAFLKHPNSDIKPEHIEAGMKSDDFDEFIPAASHKDATREQLERGLTHANGFVREMTLAKSPNVTESDVETAFNDTNRNVVLSALSHPKASSKVISDALQSKDQTMQLSASRNPNITSEHIQAFLDSPAQYKYYGAKQKFALSPKVTKMQLFRLAKDPDYSVQTQAKKNPLYNQYFPNGHEWSTGN